MGGSGWVSGWITQKVTRGPTSALPGHCDSGPVTPGQKGPTHGVTPSDRRTLVTAEPHPVLSHTQ